MESVIWIVIIISTFTLFYLITNKKENWEFILTNEFKEILNILDNTRESIFITGKAGTGKSSLLEYFTERTNKNYVILAPTGVAALNVGGQTIHSFFKFFPFDINPNQITPDFTRAELFENLDMVIIDEVSMVRADLMHKIDISLRRNRNKLNEPFGGVQMVFIGDLFQLPPILPNNERNYIMNNYGGQYFFNATVFGNFKYHFKELTKIFRQSEEEVEFKNLLNNIRVNKVSFEDMTLLNSRYRNNTGDQENSIFLTTTNNIARNINNNELEQIKEQEFIFNGELSGRYIRLRDLSEEGLEKKLPAPYKLKLKKGAQIMMLKNDSGKRWVNGSIGKIEKIENNKIIVNIKGNKYLVEKESWNEVEYFFNNETENFEEKEVAGFKQYPIRLSYAITIHKSQGKTFEKITIDVGNGAFAHGQIYVALSRCTTLDGIVLNNPINENSIIVDPMVVEYYNSVRG